jgi:hypothetical protein
VRVSRETFGSLGHQLKTWCCQRLTSRLLIGLVKEPSVACLLRRLMRWWLLLKFTCCSSTVQLLSHLQLKDVPSQTRQTEAYFFPISFDNCPSAVFLQHPPPFIPPTNHLLYHAHHPTKT